jgi:hypothetical protein
MISTASSKLFAVVSIAANVQLAVGLYAVLRWL